MSFKIRKPNIKSHHVAFLGGRKNIFVGYTLGMHIKPCTEIVDYVHFLKSSSL